MPRRLVAFTLVTSLLALLPVQAEEIPSTPAQPGASTATMEARIRAYRESFDQRQTQMKDQRQVSPVLQQRDERRDFYRKQQEERQALMEKWNEARQKYQEVRMDTFMKQREQRLAFRVQQQEALRNRAEDEHNYLVENQEKILSNMLEQKIAMAARHEEMRKQADERRKMIVAMRTALQGMTPEERRTYIEEHRQELFGAASGMQRRYARPPHPPWMQQRPPVPPQP